MSEFTRGSIVGLCVGVIATLAVLLIWAGGDA